jgi:endoglucanase
MRRWNISSYKFGIALLFLLGPLPAHAQIAFETHRAINIARWFTWPRYEKAPATGIMWPPYANVPAPPSEADLKTLHEAGFDTVRLPVDPAPFMVFGGERREAVYRILFDAIRRIQGAGLKVIVDLHPNSRHPVWGQHAVIAGLDAPAFVAYSNMIEEMARRLAPFGTKNAALELMNEPRLKCKGSDQSLWEQMLARMVQRARAGNPKVTLVATGACVSSADGLIALNPAALGDKNMIYTFHFYDPFAFTHQGAQFIPWPEKYLDEVPWPAGARPIETPMALIAQNVAADPKLDFAGREKAKLGAENNLRKFYASHAGLETIEKKFAEIAHWADEHGISRRQIFIGEFGVLRKEANKPGALCADRMRWLADIRKAADHQGFAWSYFSYDGPFALIMSDNDRRLDQPVLASLGLKHTASKCEDRAD